jgi:hypothetical protein
MCFSRGRSYTLVIVAGRKPSLGLARAAALPVTLCAAVLCAAVAAAALTTPSGRAESTPPLTAFGALPQPVAGVRPLLTILLDFSDVGFSRQHSADFYRRLLFGRPGNIARFDGFMGAMSHERLSFASAGVVGPYRLPDDPASPADESTIACIVEAVGCSTTDTRSRAQAIAAAVAGGYDFARYDRNGDGLVTSDELMVLLVVAAPEGDARFVLEERPRDGAPVIGWVSREPGPGLVPIERFRREFTGDFLDTVRAADGSWPPSSYTRWEVASPLWVHSSPGPGRAELRIFYSASRMDYALGVAGHPPATGVDDGRPADYRDVRSAGGWIDTARTATATHAIVDSFGLGDAGVWGSLRGTDPGCVPAGRVSVCVSVPAIGEAASAMTLAHELVHAVGIGWEAYGSSCRNESTTTMSCTAARGADLRKTVGLDPYSRLHLGWLEPRVLPTTARGCFALSPSTSVRTADAAPEAYLLYDPRRGTDEVFLLEYRYRRSGSYDHDPFRVGAAELRDEGLAAWVVRKDANGVPLNLPAYDGPGQDNAVFLIPPEPGTLGEPRGSDAFWDGGSLLRLRFIDGTPSGAVVRIAAFRPGDATIQFGLNRTCTAPVELPRGATQRGFDRCRAGAGLSTCSLDGPLFTVTRRTSATTDPAAAGTIVWTATPKAPLRGTLEITQQPGAGAKVATRRVTIRLRGRKPVRVSVPFRAGQEPGLVQLGALLRYRPAPGERGWSRQVAGWLEIDDGAAPPLVPETAFLGPPVAPPLPPTPPAPAPAPTPKPDLVVTSLTKTSVTVRNQGDASAAGFSVRITLGGQTVHTFGANGLAAGASTSFPYGCLLGTIGATADADGTVAESDEGNNSAQTTNAKCP